MDHGPVVNFIPFDFFSSLLINSSRDLFDLNPQTVDRDV